MSTSRIWLYLPLVGCLAVLGFDQYRLRSRDSVSCGVYSLSLALRASGYPSASYDKVWSRVQGNKKWTSLGELERVAQTFGAKSRVTSSAIEEVGQGKNATVIHLSGGHLVTVLSLNGDIANVFDPRFPGDESIKIWSKFHLVSEASGYGLVIDKRK